MSSQRGNVARSRPQRHQNVQGFRNDKYDSSAQRKDGSINCRMCSSKINAKVHEGLCQRCKEVLEWRVKFNKYKPLTQPKKCVKCLQKTVKDSYHIICKPCACELDLCTKCGKREEIVIPIQTENEPSRLSMRAENHPSKNHPRRNNRRGELEGGCEINLSDTEDEDEDLLVKQMINLN